MSKTKAGDKKNSNELPESERDKKYLTGEDTTIDMPDVNDIPGQQHIHVPSLGELADTTASSADEEGDDVFNEDENNDETNVSEDEKDLLQRSSESMAGEDDEAIRKIQLDNKDNDNEMLSEGTDLSGKDLDVPGAEDDDANEDIGEEDEENNSYSWAQ
jgi:hypothetical protein